MDEFVVPGQPIPQGSMRHVGGGRIVSKNPKLKKWRERIAKVVNEQVGSPGHTDPMSVTVLFQLQKPESAKRDYPTVPPDLDKLQRAIGDALSIDAGYIKDDAQIVEWHATKQYGQPSVIIRVVPLSKSYEKKPTKTRLKS
jgi:Holliday junction resolvase RusA-like endonuclease